MRRRILWPYPSTRLIAAGDNDALRGSRNGGPPFLLLAPPLKVGVDEHVEVTVEHPLDVAHLDLGSKVLRQLISLQRVGPYLSAPGGLGLPSPYLVDSLEALSTGILGEPSPQDLHRPGLVLHL